MAIRRKEVKVNMILGRNFGDGQVLEFLGKDLIG
jgi:hypothetical protein